MSSVFLFGIKIRGALYLETVGHVLRTAGQFQLEPRKVAVMFIIVIVSIVTTAGIGFISSKGRETGRERERVYEDDLRKRNERHQ